MDKNKIVKAIDYAIAGLKELREAIVEGMEEAKPSTTNTNSQINSEALAKKVAYAYTTKHPEYDSESQLKNLKEMIQSDKISYVITWIRRGDISGIENFFDLAIESKRKELLIAIDSFGDKIKTVFTQRFTQK